MSFSLVCEGFPSRIRIAALLVSGLVFNSVSTGFLPASAQANPPRSHSTSRVSAPRVKTVRSATVRVSTAFLRSAPGENKAGRALLDKGHSAKIIGEKGEWVRLRLISGTEGWVRADLLKVKEKSFQLPRPASKVTKTAAAKAKNNKLAKMAKAQLVAASASRKSAKAAHLAKTTAAVRANAAKRAAATAYGVNRAARFSRAAHAQAVRIALRATLAEPKIIAPVLPEVTTATSLPARALVATSIVDTAIVTARRIDEDPGAVDTSDAEQTRRAVREIIREVTTETHSASYNGGMRGLSRVRTALAYRGARYRSGATGRGGFDCSGFMVFLLAREGKSLPRTASQQFHAGTKVERGNLRPGDLVFFKNTYKSGISHVGLYTGEGQFIHAANRRLGVKVDFLRSSYYANHWAGARRPH